MPRAKIVLGKAPDLVIVPISTNIIFDLFLSRLLPELRLGSPRKHTTVSIAAQVHGSVLDSSIYFRCLTGWSACSAAERLSADVKTIAAGGAGTLPSRISLLLTAFP